MTAAKKSSKQKKQNPFFVIEALDAGGSQTQIDLLTKHFQREKYEVLQLHFPQEDRATGRLIYDKFLLNKNEKPFSRREQALLYIQDFFSRYEDITRILHSKNRRQVVVSDRYCTSTFAYQTIGLSGKTRQEMMSWLQWLTYEATPALPQPTAIIFLDTPVEVSLQRLAKKKKDYFETKEKLTAIRHSYLRCAQEQGWLVVDSVDNTGKEKTRPALHEEIWQVAQRYL